MHTAKVEIEIHFSVAVLVSEVRASEVYFWNQNNSGFQCLNPGPELFQEDQIALQSEVVSRNNFVKPMQKKHMQLRKTSSNINTAPETLVWLL